jgi:tetratricopeptide (TPR) repeat protein
VAGHSALRGNGGIVPFWQRIHLFFLYPCRATPLLAMGLGAGAFFIAQYLPFGILIAAFVVTVSFVRYAYTTLERTARGVLSSEESFQTDASPYRPYKQIAVLIVFGIVTAATEALLGEVLAIAVYFALSLALPASVMALAMTDSFVQAIHPRVLIGIIRGIGWPYLLLTFFLNMLSGSSLIAFTWALPLVPTNLWLPLFAFLNMYFLLIMFNMMGYALYQYHDKLGLDVRRQPADPRAAEQDTIAALVEENRMQEALDFAYAAQRTRPDDLDAHERYHRLLGLAGDAAKVAAHARRYIPELLRKQRVARALEVFGACRHTDAAFRLDAAPDQIALARGATRQRQDKLAMQLLLQFDRHYRNSPDVPAAWLLQAQVLTERLKQDKTALQVLKLLLSKYPDAAEAGAARQLMGALERITQAAPG